MKETPFIGTCSSQAWQVGMVALRGAYLAEVHRLANALEPRIRAGEFSGPSDESLGPPYTKLEEELQGHPWVRRSGELRCMSAPSSSELLVLGCSSWPQRAAQAAVNPETGAILGGCDVSDGAACLAHDVLQAAADRGWVKPMTWLGASSWYDLVRLPARSRPTARCAACGLVESALVHHAQANGHPFEGRQGGPRGSAPAVRRRGRRAA